MSKNESPPPAPDPYAVAAAQGEQNRLAIADSSRLNAVDKIGPFGTTTYQFGDRGNLKGVPISQTTSLNPTQQNTFETQEGIGNVLAHTGYDRLNNIDTTPFSMTGMPYDPRSIDVSQMPTYSQGNLPNDPRNFGNIENYDQGVRSAVYGQFTADLDPRFAKEKAELEQSLANRGIGDGNQQGRALLDDFERRKNSAYDQAGRTATTMAGSEAQRSLGMAMGVNAQAFQQNLTGAQQGQADWLRSIQTGQSARGQSINDELTRRNQVINEISAILKGGPSIGMPAAPPIQNYQIAAPSLENDVYNSYNAQMKQYQAEQAQTAAMWQGVMGIGSAALGVV